MNMLKTLRFAAALLLYLFLKFVGLKSLAAKLDEHATKNAWGC
jgi:hypothetical protein